MLKKLVKYGNSTALVLDKAILELLNMGEGSIVKIKTDGVSLIITPQHETEPVKVSEPLDPQATMMEAMRKAQQDQMAVKYSRQPTPKDWAGYWEVIDKVLAQYQTCIKELMENPEYQKEAAEMQKKIYSTTSWPRATKNPHRRALKVAKKTSAGSCRVFE